VANFRTVPGLGIAGPHVSTFEQMTAIRTHTASYEYTLKNITPGGMYWVEFWYRDAVPGSTLPHLIAPIVQIYFYGKAAEHHPDGGFVQQLIERSHGRWRKCALRL